MGEEVITIESPVKGASIVLKRNFKEEYGWEIKIPYDPSNEHEDDILNEIIGIDRKLRTEFGSR